MTNLKQKLRNYFLAEDLRRERNYDMRFYSEMGLDKGFFTPLPIRGIIELSSNIPNLILLLGAGTSIIAENLFYLSIIPYAECARLFAREIADSSVKKVRGWRKDYIDRKIASDKLDGIVE